MNMNAATTEKTQPPSDEGDKLEDIADGNREIERGGYLIAYAVPKAEGMYVPKNRGFEWQAPTDEKIHIEVAVRDRTDRRLIPGLDIPHSPDDALISATSAGLQI